MFISKDAVVGYIWDTIDLQLEDWPSHVVFEEIQIKHGASPYSVIFLHFHISKY